MMGEEELKAAFESRRSSLDALGNYVRKHVMDAFVANLGSEAAAEKFFQIPPKHRVKETDSFLEKALVRKPKADPLTDIHDQVGIRFVVLLLENIDSVGRVIQAGPWLWQKDRDHEKERLEKPDYFAYQSDHYVVTTSTKLEIDGVTVPVGFSCEIQIRTILQHAYAEMAHSCDYKPSIKLPDESQRHIKRSLAKGSALIETTDEVFADVVNRIREYGESTDALLEKASEIYSSLTGATRISTTAFGYLVADEYRELLRELTPAILEAWVRARPSLGATLKLRAPTSVFYRDPVVILIAWLVINCQTSVPRKWPVEMSYLEELYLALGVSTTGLF